MTEANLHTIRAIKLEAYGAMADDEGNKVLVGVVAIGGQG
jgi:hypothetical protein